MAYRTERDSLGDVKVPADAYYGAQTARAASNFLISSKKLPFRFIQSYAMIKYAAAKANMATARLDSKKGHAILKSCSEIMNGQHVGEFVVDAYQAGAGTSTNMNVNEVIANRATELMGGKKGHYIVHPNDDVNMAQSTNDTFHSTIHVSAYLETRKSLLPALKRLEESLSKKSREFRHIVKAGRTHLQDAVPITLGQEFSGYAAAIGRNIKGTESAVSGLLEINLGGTAVGTGINAEPKYTRQVYTELNRLTRSKFYPAKNMFEATQNIGGILGASSALRHTAIDLIKITSDLRLLSSSAINEITLPTVQPGSSIMPGKVNPSIPEMTGMVAQQVVGNDTVIANSAASAQLEINVYMPVAAYNLLDSIGLLTNSIITLSDKCVNGIKPDEERIGQNLSKDPVIATALTSYLGYKKAAEIVKEAEKAGKSVKEVCLSMKLLSEKEIDRILNTREMTKPGVPKKGK